MPAEVIKELVDSYREIPDKTRLEVLRTIVCAELCIILKGKHIDETQRIPLRFETVRLANTIESWLIDFIRE